MKFNEIDIAGAYIIDIEKYEDDRGFFARGFCEKEFKEQGISFRPVQANIGYSRQKYTLRGLHYQRQPYAEAKLVRCVKGALYDVVVDLRPESPTYKKWKGIELSADDYTMFYVPEGCAHGYQTLEEDTEIFYMVSAFYAPDFEGGIRWNDPTFDIKWPETGNIITSEKDQNWPDYQD